MPDFQRFINIFLYRYNIILLTCSRISNNKILQIRNDDYVIKFAGRASIV